MAAETVKNGAGTVLLRGGAESNAPAANAANADVSDTVDLLSPTRALYIEEEGDVTVNMLGGQTGQVFANLLAGTILPIAVTRIYETGTTATVKVLW